MKLKLIEDYENEKSLIAITCQSYMSHSNIAMILKNKMMKTIKGSDSLKMVKLKLQESPYEEWGTF